MRARVWGFTVAVGVLLLLAAAALAASPVKKGGSYHGMLASPRNGITVNFKVSSDGKKVTALKINDIPFYCPGGGAAIPVKFKNAAIASNKFSSTGKYVIKSGPRKGQLGDKLSITGTFSSGGHESGTIKTTVVGIPACSGKSKYSTTG